MNEITFGSGTIYLSSNDNKETVFNVLEFTEEQDEVVNNYIITKPLIPSEASFECKAKINRKLLYMFAYGSNPWYWPVSNNWLKMHEYHMRRTKF
jgi:hypothetical protein